MEKAKKRKSEDLQSPNESQKLQKTEDSTLNNRPSSKIVGISRTIAACQRCRNKKTKCDQQFPSCARCLKAGVPCVGLDPATGRQVPRSYVIHLEDKISALETLLRQNGIDPESSTGSRSVNSPVSDLMKSTPVSDKKSSANFFKSPLTAAPGIDMSPPKTEIKEEDSIRTSMNLAIPSTDKNGLSFYLGDSSGIPFAKVLFTAVKFHPTSINENNSITTRVPNELPSKNITTQLPTKSTAEFFIKSYFEQSNTQLPILHREYFIDNYFKPVYGNLSSNIKLASNYTKMNFNTEFIANEDTWYFKYSKKDNMISTPENTPVEYHKPLFFLNMVFAIASSINLLHYNPETSNSYKQQAMLFVDSLYSSEDRLECLQCLLMLTLYSIMRPSTPGCWYVLGTTLRLCVDLGLHTEKLNHQFTPFVKDLRRRLFWCAYSLDRQICVYLGRPFGIPEESISTKFPVDLDDCLINYDEQDDYVVAKNSLPTYKTISINFFKIRRIQAEILQVLYFGSSQLPRNFSNLNEWKLSIDEKLEYWFRTIPLKTSRKSNCDFNFEFFKLNYYHTKLLLFGVTPKNFKANQETFQIIFEASKGIIDCYSELFRSKTINYTWAAVHNLFMAGTSFFYAIYNSKELLISLENFESYTNIVIQVLNSLVESCDAASPCVEIFQILSLAMVRLRFENQGAFTRSGDIDEIDKFFQQLNEKTPSDYNNTNMGNDFTQFSAYESVKSNNTPERISDDLNYPSLSTPPKTGIENSDRGQRYRDFEQLKIFELMNQVSSDSIWEQFFGNGNFTAS